MLYRELKSSQKSYLRNRSHTNPLDGTNATNVAGSNTKSKRYGPHSKYGRNSVVIMSAAGWQESQEALQDPTSTQTSRSRSSPNSSGGVLKTEEVRVHHERLSTFSDENSIELKNMGNTASGTSPKGNAPSF